MKIFAWNTEKNELLLKTRGITFDEIVSSIGNGCFYEDTNHPNPEKYPDQRILAVEINDYVYLVPYVVDKDICFLKTIIPSRKATKNRRKRGSDEK